MSFADGHKALISTLSSFRFYTSQTASARLTKIFFCTKTTTKSHCETLSDLFSLSIDYDKFKIPSCQAHSPPRAVDKPVCAQN